ncbi:heat shock cognate 70 [Suillus paluster]|uniref:heat shock cognate 70 n=1 Tax=Suillus paluster TaxID=48578 RepID=UPI001B86F440|nr:heat shock cognate 70 [Suillus paluster]KAG1726006.1 heat shock cognate 70 [Suillus paluster]
MITALGIDLGTSSCCVGVWNNDHVEIIANEHGNRTTPCYVSMVASKCLIGEQAKSRVPSHPSNTIFNVKRFIGRKFNDLEVQSVMKYYPYDLINKEGRPYISVDLHQGQQDFSAEEISSMILTKMKGLGESHLGAPCTNAVINVPAYFTDAQRRATLNAARRAGLGVLRLLNDSTAVAIAHTLANDSKEDIYKILVVDLGAGALDVTLFDIDERISEVKTVAGDCHLGGEDFDDRLVFHFVQEFRSQHNKDISSDPRALWRLRAECECAKRALSSATRADIAVERLHDGIDFYSSITRVQFEALCSDLFQRMLDQIQKALRNMGEDSTPVAEIVLVGGSTRIPRIQTMISEIFGGKLPIKSLNPEAVATGAAVMAAILSGDLSPRLDGVLALDVASLSLGIQTAGGVMTRFINSSVTIPTLKSQTITTYADNQSTLIFRVFEGDKEQAKDNNLLGIFELSEIPPAPRGVPQIRVTFDIDANNILSVIAHDQNTGRTEAVTVSERLESSRNPDDIKSNYSYQPYMAEDALTGAKKTLEWYTSNVRSLISEDKLPGTLKASEKASLEFVVKQAEELLSITNTEDVEQYTKMQRILETTSLSILRKHGSTPN